MSAALIFFFFGGGASAVADTSTGGGADGPDDKKKKKKKPRRVYSPEELVPAKSVEEQVEEYLRAKREKAKPKPVKPRKAAKVVVRLTPEELEAADFVALQKAIDDEEEEIIMLLMAA